MGRFAGDSFISFHGANNLFLAPNKGSYLNRDIHHITVSSQGQRNRLQWFNTVELERQRAHSTLRSPEVAVFAQMAMGDQPKEAEAVVSYSTYR